MKTYEKIIIYLLAFTFIGLIGCEPKGPLEKSGERVDEVIDNVKHGDAPLKKKGPMEKMGESIDDSLNDTHDKI